MATAGQIHRAVAAYALPDAAETDPLASPLAGLDARLQHASAPPMIVPDTIVIDHGKVFVVRNLSRSVLRRHAGRTEAEVDAVLERCVEGPHVLGRAARIAAAGDVAACREVDRTAEYPRRRSRVGTPDPPDLTGLRPGPRVRAGQAVTDIGRVHRRGRVEVGRAETMFLEMYGG